MEGLKHINNEKGSAIVVALLVLCALTILGLSSITTSTTEQSIARNERIYSMNFYQAESAALQGLQELESATYDELDDRTFLTFTWLKSYDENRDFMDIDDDTVWDTAANAGISENHADAEYAVVEVGIAEGASLDMSATSNLFTYEAWGHSTSENGKAIIEIGYRKRH